VQWAADTRERDRGFRLLAAFAGECGECIARHIRGHGRQLALPGRVRLLGQNACLTELQGTGVDLLLKVRGKGEQRQILADQAVTDAQILSQLLGGAAAGIEQGLKQAGSIQRGQELLVAGRWRRGPSSNRPGWVPYPSPSASASVSPTSRIPSTRHPPVSDLEALRLEEADEGHFLTIGADVLAKRTAVIAVTAPSAGCRRCRTQSEERSADARQPFSLLR